MTRLTVTQAPGRPESCCTAGLLATLGNHCEAISYYTSVIPVSSVKLLPFFEKLRENPE